MTSIGDTLRRERQRRNLELPKIAGELKISVRFLEAMEQDEFGKLPGGVFTKSFVRQYAGFLGLDAEELAAEVGHSVEPEPDTAQLISKPKPDVPGIEIEVSEDSWQSVRERRLSLPSWLKSGVLLVVLMLVCSGVYWWWEQRAHRAVLAREATPHAKSTQAQPAPTPAPAAPQPVTNPAVSAPTEPATQATAERSSQPTAVAEAAVGLPGVAPPSAATPTPTATPAPVTPAPAVSDVPVPTPNPNATVHVGITADEQVWLRADVNGKYQFSGTLQPHESRTIDADGQVVLRLGNAGGATLTLNGKPVGPVGPKGQIKIVQFTSGGVQIIAVPKLVDPIEHF